MSGTNGSNGTTTPQPRAEWIPGRWEQRPRGWVYSEGHWN